MKKEEHNTENEQLHQTPVIRREKSGQILSEFLHKSLESLKSENLIFTVMPHIIPQGTHAAIKIKIERGDFKFENILKYYYPTDSFSLELYDNEFYEISGKDFLIEVSKALGFS